MREQEIMANSVLNNFDALTTYLKIPAQEKTLLLSALSIGVKLGVSDLTYGLSFKGGFDEFIEFIVSVVTDGIPLEKNRDVIKVQYERLLEYESLKDKDNVSKLFRILSTYTDKDGRVIGVKVDKKTGELKEIPNK